MSERPEGRKSERPDQHYFSASPQAPSRPTSLRLDLPDVSFSLDADRAPNAAGTPAVVSSLQHVFGNLIISQYPADQSEQAISILIVEEGHAPLITRF